MSEPKQTNETPAEETETAAAEPGAPEERIAELEAEFAKAKEDLLRALAEVENTRRRAERQASEARVYAIDRFANDLLPVADALTRALDAAQSGAGDEAVKNVVDGVALTERALLDAFSRNGLKRVGARGEKFDTQIHEAVAQIPSDVPAGHVAEIVQHGYLLGERTLRAAKVVLSLGGQEDQPPQEGVDIKV